MKVEHIQARNAPELTEKINRFLEHVKKEYNDEPYLEIFPETKELYWNAFVIYRDMREK